MRWNRLGLTTVRLWRVLFSSCSVHLTVDLKFAYLTATMLALLNGGASTKDCLLSQIWVSQEVLHFNSYNKFSLFFGIKKNVVVVVQEGSLKMVLLLQPSSNALSTFIKPDNVNYWHLQDMLLQNYIATTVGKEHDYHKRIFFEAWHSQRAQCRHWTF